MATTEYPRGNAPMPPIAIIGVGCVLPPTSRDLESYWSNLSQGVNGIRSASVDTAPWDPALYFSEDPRADDKTRCVLGGVVDNYAFPFDRYDLTEAQRELLEGANRTQQFGADSTLQAIASSSYDRDRLRASKVEVFVGNMVGDEKFDAFGVRGWTELLWPHVEETPAYRALSPVLKFAARGRYSELADERLGRLVVDPPTLLSSASAPVVARAAGLDCPGVLVDGACASGLMVIDVAIAALLQGDLDVVVAIGLMTNRSVTANVTFDKIGGLATTASRPLAEAAEGLVPGEGSGTLLLKRLDRALADDDRIYGVIRGVATTSDGAGKAIFAPDSRGQVAAMRLALDRAGVTSRDIDYLEAHATGTPTGDAVEVESIDQIVTADGRPTPLPIGSGKALIGHGFPAAGMSNLIKILLAFDHGVRPPVFGVDQPNESLRRASDRLRLVLETEPWPVEEGRPRRALTNAFGFGGVNATVVVEQFDPAYHRALLAVEPPPRSVGRSLAVIAAAAELPGLSATEGLPSAEALAACFHQFDHAKGTFPVTGWKFPYREIRIPPITLAQTDRSQQLFLTVAMAALRQANLLDGKAARLPDRIGAIVGAASGLYATIERSLRIHGVEIHNVIDALVADRSLPETTAEEWHKAIQDAIDAVSGPTTEAALPGYMDNIVAGRVANRFDLRAPNFLIDADMASFGLAIQAATQLLDRGDADFLVLGGTNSMVFEALAEIWQFQAGVQFSAVEAAVALVVCRPEDVPEDATVLGYLSAGESVAGNFPLVNKGISALGADGAVWALKQLVARAGAGDDFEAETVVGSVIADWGWPIRCSARPTAPQAAGSADSAGGGESESVAAGQSASAGEKAQAGEGAVPADAAQAGDSAEATESDQLAGPAPADQSDELLHLVEAESLDGLLAALADWARGAGSPVGQRLPAGADQGWRLVFEADSADERRTKADLGYQALATLVAAER